jgi:hypothetical protein
MPTSITSTSVASEPVVPEVEILRRDVLAPLHSGAVSGKRASIQFSSFSMSSVP